MSYFSQIVRADTSEHSTTATKELTNDVLEVHNRFARQVTKKKATVTKKATTKKGTTTKKRTTTKKKAGATTPKVLVPQTRMADISSMLRMLPIPSNTTENNDYESTGSYTDYTDMNDGFPSDDIFMYHRNTDFELTTTQRSTVNQNRHPYRYYYDYVPPRQTRYFNPFSFNRRWSNKWYWRG